MIAAASRAASSALSNSIDRATFRSPARRWTRHSSSPGERTLPPRAADWVIAGAHDPLSWRRAGRARARGRVTMRLKGYRQSSNVEDRRGMSVGRGGAAIGGGGIILLLVFALVTGQDPV